MSPSVNSNPLVLLYQIVRKLLRYTPFLKYFIFGNHIFRPLLRKFGLGELIDQHNRQMIVFSQAKTYSTSMHFFVRSLKKEFVFYNPTQKIHRWDQLEELLEQNLFLTLVRNPVERYISQFFHGLMYHDFEWNVPFPQFKNQFLDYLDRRYHNFNWFDEQIKPNLGVDIYAKPFPERGSDTYAGKLNDFNWRWLVLKAELDDATKIAVIKDFIGYKRNDFQFEKHNDAGSLPYSEHYLEFKQKLTIPPKYLDKLLEHRYAKHFYSEAERAATYAKWVEK